MKDFQFVIQNFLKNHEKHKKYIALLLVLSIVVSFAVPFSLIMPAVSMTGELICGMEEHIHSDECYELSCGLEESDEHLHNADCYTLVCDIPEHIHSQECYSDYQEENNFDFENLSPDAINISNVMATDEQGRTLVSNMNGGVDANDRYSKGQLSEVSLLIGDGVEWAANCKNANDVIEAAKRKYFLGIASDFCIFLESNFNPSNADAEGRVAVGGDVNFTGSWNYQIGNGDYTSGTALKNTDNYTGVTDFAHAIANGKIKNINTLSQGKEGDGSYMYPADEDLYKRFVIGSSTDINNCSHLTWPGAVDTLYQVTCSHNNVSPNEVAQFYQADLINFTDTFTWLRQQSEKLSKKTATGTTTFSNGVLTLDGPGVSSDAKTVYFTMNEWDDDIREIRFANVPDNANLIVNCGGNANIGVNGKDDIFSTYINDTCISRQDCDGQSANANNNKKSEQILYNFYNATNVFIDANFNGTILAPNADVTSGNDCNGHLSGSLIAKTFTGGLEFGYRPYRGGMEDILGSSMGYTIPVDKFVKDTNQLLAGAKFDIIENYDTENAKIVNSFTSGNDTNYVDIPSKVDFTGGTNYSGGEKFTGTYTIKEVSAPEGYIADTGKPYTVKITEEIQSDGLIETGSGTIPTHIKATVEFSNGSSFEIELKDIYSYDGSSSKQIRRELTINKNETFYLEIDNGKVSEVSKKDDNNKLAESGSVVTTTIIENPNAEKEINTAVTVYQTDAEGNQLTDSEKNPIPETQTTEVIVTDNPLQEYTIGCIRFMTDAVSQGNLTFYYNGGESKTYNDVPFTTDKDGQLFDLSNLSDLKYDGVVGIAISFDKDVSAVLRIQKNNGSDWGCIFGTDWGSQVSFQANAIQYFNDGTNPANTTTNVSTVTEVVTTSITSVSYFTSYSVSSNVFYYDKYATIIADPSNATTYTTTVNAKYYYNPDDIMMMPMPSENLKFENRCGLLFKKVDSNGNPLSGATIKLQYKDVDKYTDVDNAVWNWTGSSFTIDPSKLNENVVYKFVETDTPAGYETAPDIYFKKISDTEIHYASSEDDLNDNTKYTALNLMDNRTITMTDTKITGAKVKLKKTKDDGTTPLDGAKFKLYSADDETTPIYPTSGDGFTVTNGEIDLYETFKNDSSNTNPDYIQNGYLKEGLYYLYEVSAPAGYKGGQKFYFTVNKNNGVYDVVTGKPTYVSFAIESTNEGKQIWARGNASNVTKVEIKVTSPADGQSLVLYEDSALKDKTATIQNGVATFEFETPLSSVGDFKIQNVTYNNGAVVTEVKVYGDSSSGGSSIYDINSIIWNDANMPNLTVDELIFYYADNTNSGLKSNISVNAGNNGSYWHTFNLPYDIKKDNVIGVYIKVSGSGTGKLMIMISGNIGVLGTETDQWTNGTFTTVTAGNGYTIGLTSLSNSSEENTENESTGSIDKDTNAPTGYIGLIAKNSPVGDKTSITVKKEWVDDTGYETTLRPDKITVQLYRSTTQNLALTELNDSNSTKIGNDIDITQDTNGKWEYTWTNLDTKDSNNQNYYYYVKEEVTALNDYTVSYENNGITSGDVKIKNTLKTVDISVKKDWSVPDGVTGVTNPASVTVKLQTSSDGTSWTDVSGKTLTLNESNSWTGKFEKLPEGKYYRVVETNIPNGWTVSYSTDGKKFDNSGNITVTNTLSLESLNIKKNWEDNVGDVRPDKINIKLYRSTTPPAGSATSNSVQPISLKEPANNYEDYSRLLQYSLYFYDANMCGDDVANSSDLTWRNNCHTDDAVLGGYHDAGDHVMFGLPQGYTASTLGWSYYENQDIYDGLGQTDHYQKIMKRFCDFFLASSNETENGHIKRLLYQKGNADTDHSYWGSPEQQPSRANEMSYVSYGEQKGSDIAAEYAAALALYYLNFPDSQESADYLERAKLLYEFSIHNSGATPVSGYDSKTYLDDQAWAAAWLYLATNEETYKTDCKNLLDTFKAIADERGYFWGDVELGAMVVYKRFIDPAYNWSAATDYLSSKCQGNSFVVLDEWGSARHNTALQMVALSASKVDGVDYTDWCKKQMNFILGDNTIASNGNSSTCFVVGFANNSAKYPHHRGASCISGYGDDYNNNTTYPNGHEVVGALVGGPNSSYSYSDNFKDANSNEVALDYNATLVGAAAALFDVYGTGTLVTDASQIGTKGEVEKVYSQPNPVLTVYGKSTMYKGKTQILTAENATGTVTWSSSDSGILTVDENGLVTAVSNGKATITATDLSDNSTASFDITVTSSAIVPDIPEGLSPFMSITLTKKADGSWTQLVKNLPITDGQGNTYYYYIAEVDDRGEIISNKVSGYIPVEYDNGKSLSETGNTELSVTNKKSDVDEGSMPSTGGTGTQPYKVIGMVMTGGALIMLGIRRRKKHY